MFLVFSSCSCLIILLNGGLYSPVSSQCLPYKHIVGRKYTPESCVLVLFIFSMSYREGIVWHEGFNISHLGADHILWIIHLNVILIHPDPRLQNDDVIKWNHFPRYWPFLRGNSTVPGEFPAQWPVTRIFDVFLDLRLNKRLRKQSWSWWFESQTPSRPSWRHRNEMKVYWLFDFKPVDFNILMLFPPFSNRM